jgi:cytoplasmic iron level regulating protein YaaA (DUF328/UPF0246 family)
MLFLLSPAKSLDYDTPVGDVPHTPPLFVQQSAELIQVLRQKSPQQIAELMSLSDALSALNVARYQAWTPKFTARNSRQAVLAFNGDVYEGLDARTLKPKDLEWAQDHLCILSGLYGVLRPLDRIQPYRLEMGTKLATGPQARNLYQFWGARIAQYLNERLAADKSPVVEYRAGGYKVISFMAKRARGLMARYAATHRIATPRRLEGFNLEGYAFDAAVSQPERLVFRRRIG